MDLNQCVNLCRAGFYGDFLDNTCKVCSNNCLNCVSTSVCISCNTGYFLDDLTQCVNSCKNGFYGSSSDSTCKICISNCSICVNSSNCILVSSNCYVFFW